VKVYFGEVCWIFGQTIVIRFVELDFLAVVLQRNLVEVDRIAVE
jgi:hypothetical protein